MEQKFFDTQIRRWCHLHPYAILYTRNEYVHCTEKNFTYDIRRRPLRRLEILNGRHFKIGILEVSCNAVLFFVQMT